MISKQSPTQLRYHQAIKYCADLVENGYDDWKLATFYEGCQLLRTKTVFQIQICTLGF